MEIKIITKENLAENREFLRANIGYAFNFDISKEELQECFADPITPENFAQKRDHAYQSAYEGETKAVAERGAFIVCACDDKHIYSFAIFEKYNSHWCIDGMTTRIEKRRQGLAESILRAGLEKMQKDMYLYVLKNNLPAKKLYDKLGFEVLDFAPDGLEWQEDRFLMKRPCKTNQKIEQMEKQ